MIWIYLFNKTPSLLHNTVVINKCLQGFRKPLRCNKTAKVLPQELSSSLSIPFLPVNHLAARKKSTPPSCRSAAATKTRLRRQVAEDVLSSDISKKSSRNSASNGRGETVEVSQSDKSDATGQMTQTEAAFQHSMGDLIQNHCSHVLEGLQLMERISPGFDLSHLRRSVELFLANAGACNESQSAMSMLEERSSQRAKEMKNRIHEVQIEEKKQAGRVDSLETELAEVEKMMKASSKSVEEAYASLTSIQKTIQDHEEELAQINKAFDEEAYQSLKSSQFLFEEAQKALKDQNPFT